MAAPWHTPQEQYQAVAGDSEYFTGDGTRQVYGRLGLGGRLVLLPESGPEALVPRDRLARTFRSAVADRDVHCPVAECGPFFKVRGGVGRAFVHRNGHPGHPTGAAAESVWHLQAKETLRRWLEEQIGASVQVDDTVLMSKRGETVKPDVLAALPDGQRLAFEVQYSDLNHLSKRRGRSATDQRPKWRRRQDVYDDLAAEGSVRQVVWLFAAAGHYWRPLPAVGDRVRIKPLAPTLAMLRAHVAVHWFSPVYARIGTPYLPMRGKPLLARSNERWEGPPPHALGERVRPWRDDHDDVFLHGAALQDCSVDAGTFQTPGDQKIAQSHERRRRHEDNLRARARAAVTHTNVAPSVAEAELSAAESSSAPALQPDSQSQQTSAPPDAEAPPAGKEHTAQDEQVTTLQRGILRRLMALFRR